MSGLSVPTLGVGGGGSRGNATGSLRNKTALRPGHSLMDWIRLCGSGRDMLGCQQHAVTPAELAEHAKPGDCWIALNGQVYNVSQYTDFHPGGPDELMLGAGEDATELFNGVHRWVNFESMLRRCHIGPLEATAPVAVARRPASAASAASDTVKYTWRDSGDQFLLHFTFPRACLSVAMVTGEESAADDGDTAGSRFFYCRARLAAPLDGDCDEADESEYEFRCRRPHPALRLAGGGGECSLTAGGTVATVRLGKRLAATAPTIGPVDLDRVWRPRAPVRVFPARLAAQPRQLTPDTLLYRLCWPPGSSLGDGGVPVGWHVYCESGDGDGEGVAIRRAYTPVAFAPGDGDVEGGDVSEVWPPSPSPPSARREVALVVKLYEAGAFTEWLSRRVAGDVIQVSLPDGKFSLSSLVSYDCLALIAAGSGITPMVNLTLAFLAMESDKRVLLLYYNRTERDIILRDYWDRLSARYPGRLVCRHSLTRPGSDWPGATGRVSAAGLAVACSDWLGGDLDLDLDPGRVFTAACGPDGFLASVRQAIDDAGAGCPLSTDRLFLFEG